MYAAFSQGDAETEKLNKTSDGMIGPAGFSRVLSDGRGGIQTAFADEDHIIASTNNPMTIPSNNNAGMMAMVASMQSATEKAISGMQNTISSVVNRPVNVSMNIDGTKVGEAAVNGVNNRNLTQQTVIQ